MATNMAITGNLVVNGTITGGGVELVSKINQVEKDIIRKHPGFVEQWFENNKRFLIIK